MIDRYDNLYPPFKQILLKFEKRFLELTKIPIYLFSGYRSYEEQELLYKKGRQNIPNEKIITNSKPGQSYHNFGLAVDYVFDSDLIKPGIQWSWDPKFPWSKIGIVAKELGLIWGGDFKSPKDYPHLQKNWGIPLTMCNTIYQVKGLSGLYSELDKKIVTIPEKSIILQEKALTPVPSTNNSPLYDKIAQVLGKLIK